jgi:hypothetical protein
LREESWEADVRCITCPRDYLKTVAVTTNTLEVTWGGVPNAMGYYLELGKTGFVPGTGTALITENLLGNAQSFIFTGLDNGRFYDVYIQTDCNGGFSQFSLPLTVLTEPSFCDDFFYDSGGPNGQYPNDDHSTWTFCSAEGGNKPVFVSFSLFNTQGCCDFLDIFDGTDTSSPLIGSFSGSFSPGQFMSTNPDGCLTFEFTSNGSVTGNGWEAVISCGIVNSVEEERLPFQFKVFPNPTTTELNLQFNAEKQEQVAIEMHDIMGKKVFQQTHLTTLGTNSILLKTQSLPTGTYMVSVKGIHGTAAQKVVKF